MLKKQAYRISGLKEVYTYKYMILGLVKRELRGRYKGSMVGFFWNYLTPVVQLIVYYFVFSQILKMGIDNYYAYLIAGMFPWSFFSESLSEGSGSFVSYSELVKKNYFPRCVIPIAVVTSKLVNFLIAYSLALIVLLSFSFELHTSIILLPLITLLLYLLSIGFAMILASINVYLRDTQYIVNVFLMIWVWMTPIMYLKSFISDSAVKGIIDANVMTSYIQLFQETVYYGNVPSPDVWLVPVIASCIVPLIGYIFLKITQKRMAELL